MGAISRVMIENTLQVTQRAISSMTWINVQNYQSARLAGWHPDIGLRPLTPPLANSGRSGRCRVKTMSYAWNFLSWRQGKHRNTCSGIGERCRGKWGISG
jgi:hypothetical protein